MQRAVQARRAENQLVGIGLGIVDQFLDALVWLLIVDQQNHRAGRQPRDRNEVGAREFRRGRSNSLSTSAKPEIDDNVDEQRVAVRLWL